MGFQKGILLKSGVSVGFWTVKSARMDFLNNTIEASFDCYLSQGHFDDGSEKVATVSITKPLDQDLVLKGDLLSYLEDIGGTLIEGVEPK